MKKRSILLAAIVLLLLSIFFIAGYIYSNSIVGELLLKQNSEFLYSGNGINKIEYTQTGKTILQLSIPFVGQEYPETQNNTNASIVVDYENSLVTIDEDESQNEFTFDQFFPENLIFQESFWDNIFATENFNVEESRDSWKITILTTNLNQEFLDSLESLFRKDFETKKYKLGEVQSDIDGNINLEVYISKKTYLLEKVVQRLDGTVTLSSTLGGEPIEELEKTIDISDKGVYLYVKNYELTSEITNFNVTKQIPKNSLTVWLDTL